MRSLASDRGRTLHLRSHRSGQRICIDIEAINRLVRATDGVEALEMLRGHGGREPLAPPYLLLLDIHMPRLDGIGLIRAIRADPHLTRSVIFVLTTSDDDRDKMAAYDQHVAGYIVKSNTKDELLPLMAMLDDYVLIVEPPP